MQITSRSSNQRFQLSGQVRCEIELGSVTFHADSITNISGKPCAPMLQLWACKEHPKDGFMEGVVLAQVKLESLDAGARHEAITAQATPKGSVNGKHELAITVADADALSVYDDVTLIEAPYDFVHPSLQLPIKLNLSADTCQLDAMGVANLRAGNEQSGVLTLEAWAVQMPYDGGLLRGTQLGSLTQASIQAGEQSSAIKADFAPLSAELKGEHYLCVVLKERIGELELTRDFINTAKALRFPVTSDTVIEDFSRDGTATSDTSEPTETAKSEGKTRAQIAQEALAEIEKQERTRAPMAARKKTRFQSPGSDKTSETNEDNPTKTTSLFGKLKKKFSK